MRRKAGDFTVAAALAVAILGTCFLSWTVPAAGLKDSTVTPAFNPQPHQVASIGAHAFTEV
ncbi:hypothetical protein Mpe_B0249 (plasmid) [Methylibium petroleiphilum PM1]|uniref:Uncharacterized protein n=2 Tax=Methylibium TaxID=316612 RepID=A2SN85_METPP|nr:hypothetical protein Mpe_B0249 [Methylibium petroleiphilum PM1]